MLFRATISKRTGSFLFAVHSEGYKKRLSIMYTLNVNVIANKLTSWCNAMHTCLLSFSHCLLDFHMIPYVQITFPWHGRASQAWALRRWEPHVCAPLGCQRSCGSMKCCQEMQSNEGMYSRWETQRESEWLVQGLCLAPFLRRRDWRHRAGSCLAKRRRKKKLRWLKKKFCFGNLLRFQRAHAVALDSGLFG